MPPIVRFARRAIPVALVGALLAGCVSVKTPYDQDLQSTVLGSKVGKAHWQSILGLFAWGDAGTRAAAEDGDIEVINHADVETFALGVFLYVKRTTIVYGD